MIRPIARKGAGIIEVAGRLQRSLAEIAAARRRRMACWRSERRAYAGRPEVLLLIAGMVTVGLSIEVTGWPHRARHC